MSLSENPIFGAMIGQQINNNRNAEQIERHANESKALSKALQASSNGNC
jgi:hypothetical protein